MNTTAQDIFNSFEATFSDKQEIPESLEFQWLVMAVGKYNAEVAIDKFLNYDADIEEFDGELSQYVIDTLGLMMRVKYQERYASKVNKIASIVGKDLSVNSGMSLSKYAKEELDYFNSQLSDLIENQKPVAMN